MTRHTSEQYLGYILTITEVGVRYTTRDLKEMLFQHDPQDGSRCFHHKYIPSNTALGAILKRSQSFRYIRPTVWERVE